MADASITWISGPVLRARTQAVFSINEAALVGEQRLLGEVIRINGQEAVIQVYEDTTGLRPGDPVSATGAALSVSLGPGLLGNIFDGLLRPLTGQGRYVTPGMERSNTQTLYPFMPLVKPGDFLAAGKAFAAVQRSDARAQRCLVPPGCEGEVISVEPAGQYGDDHPVCVLRSDDGDSREISMSHRWPVRQPRPVAARMPVEGPLFTG